MSGNNKCPMCDQEGVPRMVQKDGPNKGRTFFQCPSCPSTSGQGTRFICWEKGGAKRQRTETQQEPREKTTTTTTSPSLQEFGLNVLHLSSLVGSMKEMVGLQKLFNLEISEVNKKIEEVRSLVTSMNKDLASMDPDDE